MCLGLFLCIQRATEFFHLDFARFVLFLVNVFNAASVQIRSEEEKFLQKYTYEDKR